MASGESRGTRLGLQLKRRTLQTKTSDVFQGEQNEESDEDLPFAKKAKIVELLLEDSHSKSKRLKEEGIILAESER